MTLEEVAEFLRVHPSTIYRLLKKHGIPAFKMGSDWRFSQESVERWVRERESAADDEPALQPRKQSGKN
ncbi:MAG: helix-turn-helix domain-containing protein [Candidatus Binataceae bacterium]